VRLAKEIQEEVSEGTGGASSTNTLNKDNTLVLTSRQEGFKVERCGLSVVSPSRKDILSLVLISTKRDILP
jgi:hypothetical protein